MAEIQFAVRIACYGSIAAVYHIGEIVSMRGEESPIGKLQLLRTKCSSIITKVVFPALKYELKKDLFWKYFCILVDDSTDVSTKKNVCVCLQFYSDKEKTIITAFLDLVEIVHATSEAMFDVLKECLVPFGLDFKDCIGFSSDSVSAMVGEMNSVSFRIKQVSPNCVLIKCICHFFALCVQHAFKTMPSNLGFLLKEIPEWFSNSVIRRENFKHFIRRMNLNEEVGRKPMPF